MEVPEYGTLTRASGESVELIVGGRVVRTWSLGGRAQTVEELLQVCLVELTSDGWRPISHQTENVYRIVLGRVPYTAGASLPVYGILRRGSRDEVALSVSGSIMRQWSNIQSNTLETALADLQRDGWRVFRRYEGGVTVVRG